MLLKKKKTTTTCTEEPAWKMPQKFSVDYIIAICKFLSDSEYIFQQGMQWVHVAPKTLLMTPL